MTSEGYYDILGVTKQSTQDEIRKAYRRLSLVHHPDRNGGTDDSEFQKWASDFQDFVGSQEAKPPVGLSSSDLSPKNSAIC